MISCKNLGATSEIGTVEKIWIYFKGKFWNNSLERVLAILGTTVSVHVATHKGDHDCYHYLLIYSIKLILGKYLTNMNEFN